MDNKQEVILELRKISKSFPGVRALDDISFSARQGEVHAICGENGAGKSTLMKIINGIYNPDEGEVLIRSKSEKISDPLRAKRLGISMINQECQFVPEMTVEESLFLGDLPVKKTGRVDWGHIGRKAAENIKKEGLIQVESLSEGYKTRLKYLSISEIQLLEITKVISMDADIIIMDEPTSSLANHEADILLNKVLELKERGKCILYISHKMDEIFRIADTITVFRDGRLIGTKPASELDIDKVITMMVGRELSNDFPKEEVAIGENLLEVKNLTSRGEFHDVSFHVKSGEIVGIAGLVGAGRTEVARAVTGLDPVDGGSIHVRGKEVKIRSINDSIKHGIGMISEDRRRYGLVLVRSVKENITLPNLKRFIYGGRLHANKEKEAIDEQCSMLKLKTPTIDSDVGHLSGGNQQKVVLAKWLLKDSSLMILDEPTRGIDVGAKYEIYKLMTSLVKNGKGILMISSEMPELLGMCDRIYVMSQGKFMTVLDKDQFSQETIMRYATGSQSEIKEGEAKNV